MNGLVSALLNCVMLWGVLGIISLVYLVVVEIMLNRQGRVE